MSANSSFKCILVGDSYSGKTTFVRQFISDDNIDKPAISKYGCPITFSTNVGTVCFNVFDTDGQKAFGGLRDSFFQKSHCAIVMFDVTSPSSFENVSYWYRRIRTLNGNIPVVLCGNKIDIKARKVTPDEIAVNSAAKRFKYFEISAKAKTKINAPFLHLIEKLVNKGPVVDFKIIGSEVSMGMLSLHKLIEEAKTKNNTVQFDDLSLV